MSRSLLLTLVVVALCAPALARAQQVCTFTTGPTTLNFGAYDPSATAPANSSSQFSFSCVPGNPKVNATLSAGAGTFAQRQMVLAGGSDRLNYNLYQDAAYTIIWGDGTPPSQSDTNERDNRTFTIYGRIPTGQWVSAGTYSDTITLTLNY